jgi:hypothetical protein
MEDLILNLLPGGFRVSFQVGLSCFAMVAWAIWLTKNRMCMSRVFLKNPIDIIIFYSEMTTISGVKVRELMERLLEVGLMKVEFKPSEMKLSYVSSTRLGPESASFKTLDACNVNVKVFLAWVLLSGDAQGVELVLYGKPSQ